MAAGPRPASHGGRPLLLVLSFLELPELLTAATVCRQWAQVRARARSRTRRCKREHAPVSAAR
jgi:hypothetical protein